MKAAPCAGGETLTPPPPAEAWPCPVPHLCPARASGPGQPAAPPSPAVS